MRKGPVDQSVRAERLEVPSDSMELLSGLARHLAGFRDIVEVAGQFEQRQLPARYFLFRGHDRFLCESGEVFGDAI